MPQGSILGPLLFKADICDLFYDIDNLYFASFADNSTPYSCLSDMMSVLGQLKDHLITTLKTLVEIEVSNITVISEEKTFSSLSGIFKDKLYYHVSA